MSVYSPSPHFAAGRLEEALAGIEITQAQTAGTGPVFSVYTDNMREPRTLDVPMTSLDNTEDQEVARRLAASLGDPAAELPTGEYHISRDRRRGEFVVDVPPFDLHTPGQSPAPAIQILGNTVQRPEDYSRLTPGTLRAARGVAELLGSLQLVSMQKLVLDVHSSAPDLEIAVRPGTTAADQEAAWRNLLQLMRQTESHAVREREGHPMPLTMFEGMLGPVILRINAYGLGPHAD